MAAATPGSRARAHIVIRIIAQLMFDTQMATNYKLFATLSAEIAE
jgi:hypothetical protein